MLSVTVDSTLAWLIPFAPDWSTAPVSAFELLTASDEGRSAREHRRALSATLRTTLQFAAQLVPEEADQFLAALAVPDNRPLLAPFWPAESSFADRTAVAMTGGIRVWFERDWSFYTIGLETEANPAGYSAAARTAPLVWARWDKRPTEEALTADGELDVSLELMEVGPAEYALAPQGGALVYGAAVGGSATPMLPAEYVNWNKPSASSEIIVSTERRGYGRGEVEEYVAQQARQTQKLAVRCLSCDEIARLVRLFLDRRGDVGVWWCPSFRSADAADALLVRFKAAKLQLTWATPTQADAQIEVISVPTEETLPAGETLGTTIGDLGAKIWLYCVGDGDLDWYYTSFESEIDAGALGGPEHKPFLPRPIDHGDITSEIDLQRHDTDLTVDWFAGSPFERARLDRLAPPLTVQIYEGTLAAPAAAELIFTGKAAGYQFTGGKCICKIAGPTALFDVRGPVAVTSPRCWTPMYSSLCGLSREALSVAAALVGIGADGTCRFVEDGGSVFSVTVTDHYRYGVAVRTLADGSHRRYSVQGSASVESADDTVPALGDLTTEAAVWQAAVAAAGGHLGIRSLRIVNAFMAAFSTRAYAPKIRYLLPMAGTDLAAMVTPLIDRGGWGRPVPSGFGDSDCSEARGIQGDGATKRIALPFGAAQLGAGNGGLGAWIEQPPATGETEVLGSHANGDEAYALFDGGAFGGYGFGWGVDDGFALMAGPMTGWLYGRRSTPTSRTVFRRGTVAATSTAPIAVTHQAETSAYLFGVVGLAINRRWAGRLSCALFDDGSMTDAEVADFAALMSQLRTWKQNSQLELTTNRPVSAPAKYPEPGWQLYPGCDHSWSRCKQLGNSANFRGCPHFPKSNPAMVSVKQETSSGSKK